MKTHNWNWKDLGLLSGVLLIIVAIYNQQAGSPLQQFIVGIAVGLSIGASFISLASAAWEKQDH